MQVFQFATFSLTDDLLVRCEAFCDDEVEYEEIGPITDHLGIALIPALFDFIDNLKDEDWEFGIGDECAIVSQFESFMGLLFDLPAKVAD